MDGRGTTPERERSAPPRRILSIDGGGIKGAYPAGFLAAIERSSGKRVSDHFDLIAGTSTGGIIALALGLGLSAEAILEFYRTSGPEIFSRHQTAPGILSCITQQLSRSARQARRLFGPAYDSGALRAALVGAFGHRRLGESSVRLVIPAYSSAAQSVYVFKTAHHPRFQFDRHVTAVDVALATSAAPTFFPAHAFGGGGWLLDGGIWANNPSGMAAVEAVAVLGWLPQGLRILSLGCTEAVYECPPKAGGLDLMTSAATLFMQGQAAASLGTAKLLSGHSELAPRLFRYSLAVGQGRFALDSVAAVEELAGLGALAAREALPAIRPVFLDTLAEQFVPYEAINGKSR